MKTNPILRPAERSIRILVCFLLLVFILPRCPAQVCADPAHVIYGLTSTSKIRPIHVGTGLADSALNIPLGPPNPSHPPLSNGIGYDPVNGNFYYFSTQYQFLSFNPSTNTTTILAPIPSTIYSDVLSACVNPTGTGYYCLDSGYGLLYYDIATNTWTVISAIEVDQYGNNITTTFQTMWGGDMAFDAAGDLWMVIASPSAYALYFAAGPMSTTAVPQFQVMQIIPPTTLYEDGGSIDGIAFDPSGNIYLSTNSDLYELQNGTTTISHIGSFQLDTTSEVMEDLTSCNFPGTTVLPATYTAFRASLRPDRTVLLDWQYAQPVSGGFSIDHSPDGQHWSGLGYEAAAGGGSSASYSWLDTHPYDGRNYYRIRLQSPENMGGYSPIQVIDMGETTAVTVSPNPVIDVLHLQFNRSGDGAKAILYDPSGRVVLETVLSVGPNSIPLTGLAPGIYLVSVQFGDGHSYTQKILKRSN
jgi:hypothetical protein